MSLVVIVLLLLLFCLISRSLASSLMVILTYQSFAHPELLDPLHLLMRRARDGVRGHRIYVLAVSDLLVTRTLPAYDYSTISDACS